MTDTSSLNDTDAGSDVSGAFSVTESSGQTSTTTTTGNDINQTYGSTATANGAYSMTETGSTYTLTETGSLGSSSNGTANNITSANSQTENGSDTYSMMETGTATGGAYSESVNGTESYSVSESYNVFNQATSESTSGSGTYTRTDTGPGATLPPSTASSYGYTLTASDNAHSGILSQAETGSDRYSLLQDFNNVANTSSSSNPGNMNFVPFGQPFVDPGPSEAQNYAWTQLRQLENGRFPMRENGFLVNSRPEDLTPGVLRNIIQNNAYTEASRQVAQAALNIMTNNGPAFADAGLPLAEGEDRDLHGPEETGVGQPGFGEGLIPVWGSGRAAVDDFQNGRWGWGILNSGLAVTDVFLVKAIATAAVKGGARAVGLGAARGAAETATARAARLGLEGLRRAGIIQNIERITSYTGAAFRVPDGLNHALRIIQEVKNYNPNRVLSFTNQMRDYAAYAKLHTYTFELWVNQGQRLSRPLQDAIRRGWVTLRILPP